MIVRGDGREETSTPAGEGASAAAVLDARLELLARAGELLIGSTELEETLRNVTLLALPLLGDFCFLDLVEGPRDEDVRRIVAAHQDPDTEALLAPTRWSRSERTDRNLCGLSSGLTGFHPDIDEAWMRDVATSEGHLDLLRRLRLCSMVTLPLLAQGERVGALTLCHGRSGRHHTVDDVRMGEELARRAGQAILHARLFRQSRIATASAEAAARRAEEASRAKDEFLATISHELRSPLAAILGWAQALQGERAGDREQVARAATVIERNVRAQLRLVEDILDVSRIVRGQLRIDTIPVDLSLIARDVLESVKPSADARDLTVTFTDAECRVAGDPDRLRQILWNLLSNSVKFTPPGGRVDLAIAKDGARVTIAVTDSGRGIDPAFLPRAFDRFSQQEGGPGRSHEGVGLGLALVRHLAEMHGGSVRAESDGPGKGARFVVTLPVKPFSAEVRAEGGRREVDAGVTVPAPPPAGALAGLKVLVVEDEPDSRELIELLLSGEGAVVEAAASADEALARLPQFAPDILLSDIGMPQRDGYWLIGQVRLQHPELLSIALTAFTRAEDVERVRAAGFDHHVGKPVDPDHLVQVVARAWSRSTLPTPDPDR